MVFAVPKIKALSPMKRMVSTDGYAQGAQKRKEMEDGIGRFTVKTSPSIHSSKVFKGHEEIGSWSLRSTSE